jgi:hypothetical protein
MFFEFRQINTFSFAYILVKHVFQVQLSTVNWKLDSSQDGEASSHQAVYYCLLTEIHPRDVEEPWAKL